MTKMSHESKTPGGRQSSSVSQVLEDIVREGEEVDYGSDTVFSPREGSPPSREDSSAHAGNAASDNITSLCLAYSNKPGINPNPLDEAQEQKMAAEHHERVRTAMANAPVVTKKYYPSMNTVQHAGGQQSFRYMGPWTTGHYDHGSCHQG